MCVSVIMLAAVWGNGTLPSTQSSALTSRSVCLDQAIKDVCLLLSLWQTKTAECYGMYGKFTYFSKITITSCFLLINWCVNDDEMSVICEHVCCAISQESIFASFDCRFLILK